MRLGAILGAVAAAVLALASPAAAESFHFVALGDTAYTLPRDLPTYDALIQRINKAKPAFSINATQAISGLNAGA